MTCIVGLKTEDKIYIGGDSCSSDLYNYNISATSKVFVKENEGTQYIIGGTTSWRGLQLIEHRFKIPRFKKEDENNIMGYLINKFIPELMECYKNNNFLEKDKDVAVDGTQIILGMAGYLCIIQGDYAVLTPENNYMCVGCGAKIAIGSLYSTKNEVISPEEKINMALNAATSYSSHVKPPNIIKSIDIPKEFQLPQF